MSAIPEGFQTITPSLVLKDAAKAIETYKKAFGAKEVHRLDDPQSGKIMHACIEIGTSRVFLSDEMPGMCAASTGSSFYLYVPDADATFEQAKKAGLDGKYPPTDMFWGDRTGTLADPFGVMWTVATHIRDVSEDELKKGQQEFAKQMKSGQKAA